MLVVRRPSGSLKTAVSKRASFFIFLFLCLYGEAGGGLLVVKML